MQRTILRLAFPGGKPRPKPGPYRAGGHTRPQPWASSSTPSVAGRSRVPEPGPSGPRGAGPEQPTAGVRVAMPRRA